MAAFVAFLRGVNVNGTTLKMAAVREAFEELGYENVRTVLASGNVVVDIDRGTRAQHKKKIEQQLRRAFGYEAWVVLVSAADLEKMARASPFASDDADLHSYVILGSDQAALAKLREAVGDLDPDLEAVEAGKGCLYWRVPKGRSTDTPFARVLAQKRFRETTTNRNLRTVVKVVATAS